MPKPLVALVGTLDTKGREYQWVSDRLTDNGARVLVIDAGIAEPAGFERNIDYTQHVVAEHAGSTIEALRRRNDRGFAIATMAEGVAAVLSEQLSKDDLDGVFALGGSGGSSIAARAVRCRGSPVRRTADRHKQNRW